MLRRSDEPRRRTPQRWTVFEIPIGWTVFHIPSTPWAPTVRPIGRVRSRLGASQGASSKSGARAACRWPRWVGGSEEGRNSGLLASAAMTAGRVVRVRPDMFVETPHRCPTRPGACPGAVRRAHWTRRLNWKATRSCSRAWSRAIGSS